jgi:hypothetical protein
MYGRLEVLFISGHGIASGGTVTKEQNTSVQIVVCGS